MISPSPAIQILHVVFNFFFSYKQKTCIFLRIGDAQMLYVVGRDFFLLFRSSPANVGLATSEERVNSQTSTDAALSLVGYTEGSLVLHLSIFIISFEHVMRYKSYFKSVLNRKLGRVVTRSALYVYLHFCVTMWHRKDRKIKILLL